MRTIRKLDNYKTLKMSISAVIKSWSLDHFKTKKMSKNAVKKLPFITMYVPDWYKT